MSAAPGFKPDFARAHGFAWFVWPGGRSTGNPEHIGGWASIGGEPPFEFSRARDLPKDIVWWTNLSKPEAWALGRWSHFKHAAFLGPDWLTLMSEYGAPRSIDAVKAACSAWSETFARTAEWMSRAVFSAADDAIRPVWSWGDGDWHEALSDRMGWTQPAAQSHPVMAAAYVDRVVQEVNPQLLVGLRKLTVSLPRLQHADRIWSTPFPSGDFEEVLPDQWPQHQRWEWLERQSAPILVRFDDLVLPAGAEPSAQLWLGLRGRRFAAAATESIWMTGEEALRFRHWITTPPSAALRCQNPLHHAARPSGWPTAPTDPLDSNSLVTGLLASASWLAASTPSRTPTRRIKSAVTAQAVWWRTADRLACFEAAQHFSSRGFRVLEYGAGTVTVAFDPRTTLTQDWQDALSAAGMHAPRALSERLSVPAGSLDDAAVDAVLKRTEGMEAFLMLDRLLLPWPGPDRRVLRPILEGAMRTLSALRFPDPTQDAEWKNSLRARTKTSVEALTAPAA